MQTKSYNSYRITHKDSSVEIINSESLVQALENMTTDEETSAVVQTILLREGVTTLVEDEATEVTFTSVVADGGEGSIATPASGVIHVGDTITLQAVPDDTYEFVSWQMNGTEISTSASYEYTIPELDDGVDSIVFTATFKLSDVSWTTAVSPSDAGTAGAIAFPTSGTSEANSTQEFLAVAVDGYVFDHWERNGESVSTEAQPTLTITPLEDGEDAAVYTAVFTAEE